MTAGKGAAAQGGEDVEKSSCGGVVVGFGDNGPSDIWSKTEFAG